MRAISRGSGNFARKLVVVPLVILAGLGAAACGKATPEKIGELPLVERVDFDYGRGFLGSSTYRREENCLANTAYDPRSTTGVSASAEPDSEAKTITITPANNGHELRLVLVDNLQPLQPLDAASAEILADHGCDTGPYDQN